MYGTFNNINNMIHFLAQSTFCYIFVMFHKLSSTKPAEKGQNLSELACTSWSVTSSVLFHVDGLEICIL